jgi:hypothetical protein
MTEMKPTRSLRPLHWVAIDLLALLIVVGWAMTTYALAMGMWRPLAMDVPDYWPLLAFPVAVAVSCGIAVLLGVQLSAMGVIGSGAGHQHEPRAAERPHTVEQLTREPAASDARAFGPVNLTGEPFPHEAEEEETERTLATAGR